MGSSESSEAATDKNKSKAKSSIEKAQPPANPSRHQPPANPSRHQPTDDSEEAIRPDCEDKNIRTVLIMGETGSGKSTFINSIANYFLGGSLSQLKIVIPNSVYQTPNVTGFPRSKEADLSDPSKSKTKTCTVYQFTRKGITYRFIDTPGFSDTENSATNAVDDQTVTNILQAASAAGTLHAIIIVINGSAARVTVNLKNTLERIGGNSPDILIQSMLAVFTNSSQSSRNFDVRSLPYPPKKAVSMNNMAFSSLPTTWDEDNQDMQQLSWKMSMKQMKEIVEYIDTLAAESTEVFKQMLESRRNIQSQTLLAIVQLQQQTTLCENLEQLQQEEEEAENSMSRASSQASMSEQSYVYFAGKGRELENHQAKLQGELASVENVMQTASSKIGHLDRVLGDTKQKLRSTQQHQLSEAHCKVKTTKKVAKSVSTDYHNTNCRGCLNTCHKNCSLSYTALQGDNIFLGCACMSGDYCKDCKCHYTKHVHDRTLIFWEDVVEESTDERKLAEYRQQQLMLAQLQAEEAKREAEYARAQAEQADCEKRLAELKAVSSGSSQEEEKINKELAEAQRKMQDSLAALTVAHESKAKIQAKRVDIETQLQAARAKLKEGQDLLIDSCRTLKKICSRFNFVAEIAITIEGLRTAQASMKTMKSRQEFTDVIEALQKVANELTEKMALS